MFTQYTTTIEPAWTEAGHLAVGGYMTIFDRATDCLREHVGLGRLYAKEANCGVYVVEAHIAYLRELAANDRMEMGTLIIDADAKKFHLYHEMRKLPDRAVASAVELIAVHVDRHTGRTAPFPPAALGRIRDLMAEHAREPLPALVGRRLTLRKEIGPG